MQLHEFDLGEDFWITPSVCESLNEEKPLIRTPERMKMVTDQLVKLKEKKDENEDGNVLLNRTKILIDERDGFKSFKYLNKENVEIVEIYEKKHNLLFEIIRPLFCKVHHNRVPSIDKELLNVIEELSKTTNNYHLVGNQMIRNIQTGVYRKKGAIKENKFTVVTLYLEKTQRDNSKILTHNPVQILFEKFHYADDKNNLVDSQLFNFYDFEDVEDDELVQELDVSDCINKLSIAELNIVASRGNY